MSLVKIKDDLDVCVTNDQEFREALKLLDEILNISIPRGDSNEAIHNQLVDKVQLLIELYTGNLNLFTFNYQK